MDHKNSIQIITKDIEELQNLVSNLQNYSRVPTIEVDLALTKMQNIYELLLMIRDLNKDQPSLSSPHNIQEKERQDQIHEIQDPPKEEKVPPPPPSYPAVDNFSLQSSENKKDEKKIIPAPVEEKIKKDPIDNISSPNEKEKILGEKFVNNGDFLNEKFGDSNTGKDLSAKIQSSPIKNIAGNMGINDKFFFIRELFHGNADHFRTAMDTLDGAGNFNEAFNFLNSFEWDMDSEAVQQLLSLVRRRFITPGNE